MARNIIKSNIAAVAVQNADQAFNTIASAPDGVPLRLYMGVQGLNYSIGLNHQGLKQVGSQEFVSNEIMQQPDVELEISYLAQPALSNELYGKFVSESALEIYSKFINLFSGTAEKSTNFYVFIDPNQDSDMLDSLTFDETLIDLTGCNAIAFGNCYPTTYGISYGIGDLPVVSTNYICSNVLFENVTGTSMQLPAINLTGGNNDNVSFCALEFEANTTDDSTPVLVNPTDAQSSVTLQNIQVGGQPLSGVYLVQAVNMSVDLSRVSNYGLGNDFAYGRKATLPANGSFSVSSLVSGLESGVLTGLLGSESGYDFQLVLASGSKKMAYQIEDAKLTSYSYSLPLNNQMTFDADFSFEVTETKGLKLSGTAS